MRKASIDDYLTERLFYLISNVVKTPQYNAIIYEELADQGGYSYGFVKLSNLCFYQEQFVPNS